MRDKETENITLRSFRFSSAKLDTFPGVAVFLRSSCGHVRFHLPDQGCVWASVTTHRALGRDQGSLALLGSSRRNCSSSRPLPKVSRIHGLFVLCARASYSRRWALATTRFLSLSVT